MVRKGSRVQLSSTAPDQSGLSKFNNNYREKTLVWTLETDWVSSHMREESHMMTVTKLPVRNNDMTLIVGIVARDKIVVGADGKVFDTEKGVINKPKIHSIASNCVMMLAGEQLKGVDEFVDTLRFQISDKRLKDADDIAEHVFNFTDKRTWAEYDDDRSHIIIHIYGYNGNKPAFHLRISNGDRHYGGLLRYVSGSWEGGDHYLRSTLGTRPYTRISPKAAEKVVVEMLDLAEKECPDDIGGQGLLWHVKPHKVEEKSYKYLQSLKKKYLNPEN